jgi:hypothetical protein
MKNFEDYFETNRAFFDEAEPPKGHFVRFRSKLEAQRVNQPKRVRVMPYLLRAAAVAILVTLSSMWTWEHVLSPDANKMSLGDVSPEMNNVENYYVHQVSYMEDEIKSLPVGNDPQQKEMLLNELDSMDAMYVELQKDLKANPDDQRVINAMIEHYQKKIEVMNYILTQLKEANSERESQSDNQLNNENYETVRL